MNIFVVEACPRAAARALCDKHVVAMVRETAQLLSVPYGRERRADPYVWRGWRIAPGAGPYAVPSPENHPAALWARASSSNRDWLIAHGLELAAEYTRRYGRRHASQDVIAWVQEHPAPAVPDGPLTPHVQCVPEDLRGACAVEAYRAFYRSDKARFATWRAPAAQPAWFHAVLS